MLLAPRSRTPTREISLPLGSQSKDTLKWTSDLRKGYNEEGLPDPVTDDSTPFQGGFFCFFNLCTIQFVDRKEKWNKAGYTATLIADVGAGSILLGAIKVFLAGAARGNMRKFDKCNRWTDQRMDGQTDQYIRD